MALSDIELSLLTFPQRWAAGTISFRVLLLPAGDPTLASGSGLPAFAGASWSLTATLRPGLDSLLGSTPSSSFAPQIKSLTATSPASAPALWQALGTRFNPVKPDPVADRLARLTSTAIAKELPPSYRTAATSSRLSDTLTQNRAFGCALREGIPGRPHDPKPTANVTWGAVLSFALRQPLLARALGLIYDFEFEVDPTDALISGGWLQVQLADSSLVGVNPAVLRSYAARLPALDPALAKTRALFAPLLFPVEGATGSFDTPLEEAALFDDGFAKIVHAAQTTTADAASSGHSQVAPATDVGLDLGWDDEQVTTWFNRQIAGLRARLDPTATATETPLGVSGYRIDVRDPDTPTPSAWQTLCAAYSANAAGKVSPLVFPSGAAPVFSAPFDGELTVEPAPVRAYRADDQTAWLPRYFARWQGGSLVVNDDTLFQLTGTSPKDANGQPMTVSQSSYAARVPTLPLRYGKRYEFRCRFADLTGGGPLISDGPENASANPTATVRFQRHVAPKALQLSTDVGIPDAGSAPEAEATLHEIDFWRPLISYPELTFAGITHKSVIEHLIKDAPAARAAGRAVGVYDPDVTHVRIAVQVKLAAHDPGPGELDEGNFFTLYETDLPFHAFDAKDPFNPGAPLAIALNYVDVADVSAIAPPAAGVTDLPIPTAREIRIRCRAICADQPGYFGSDDARLGLMASLTTYAPAFSETGLLVPAEDGVELKAILLQPSGDFATRVANELSLAAAGLQFAGHPGERVVFGASAKLRHTLAGDGGMIQFASNQDFFGHWLVASEIVIERDWSWNGLESRGLEISRRESGETVWDVIGYAALPFTIATNAIAGETAQRSQTRVIFFDGVEANPAAAPGSFPQTPRPEYRVRPLLRNLPDAESDGLARENSLRLPVAVAPVQTPQLVSAGVALSPFVHDAEYTSTESRDRVLWFEFSEPILNPDDRLFARVLAYGPDPLLVGNITHSLVPVPNEKIGALSALDVARAQLPNPPPPPSLAIDPELIRVIMPGQAEDSSGLAAMVEMIPCQPALDEAGPRHFLVPLPPGINPDDPRLFGFWTYEFRIGHKTVWSTAQARFGRPLIVNGIQHPAPGLRCTPSRIKESSLYVISGAAAKSRITVAASYASAIYADKKLFEPAQGDPRTQLWVLLYAQVVQADGLSRRNILLGRSPALPQYRMINGVPFAPATRDCPGVATFDETIVEQKLAELALPDDSPLSVVAVEVLPGGDLHEVSLPFAAETRYYLQDTPLIENSSLGGRGIQNSDATAIVSDPLGADLGTSASRRILRCSPLTPVPLAC